MSSDIGSIFRPRQPKADDAASSGTSVLASEQRTRDSSFHQDFATTKIGESTALELTKNNHYCVSRLPAVPAVLSKDTPSEYLNGYADNACNYAVVVNEQGVYVWSHKSADESPLTFEFPLENASSILPLAILTQPASGVTKDPGIVIINASSGSIRFYESVQHSSALGLISDKNLEITVPIEGDKGEFITFAQNVEPAGVVVVTSWKRVVLVNLRDYKSKPLLTLVQLLSPVKPSFLTGLFGNNLKDYINNDIVSVKLGSSSRVGTSQEIIIQESTNIVQVFRVHLSSTDGLPYVDSRQSFKHNLTSHLHESIEGISSFSNNTILGLDIWKLDRGDDIYLYLCLIGDQFDASGSNLLLIPLKIKQSGVLVYGAHRLNRYDGQLDIASNSKPVLFVPKPEKTAFIVLNSSIIFTDIDYSYIDSGSTVALYRPRWEDSIAIKNDIEVVGYGYEDGGPDANPAIILLTSNSGVLRFERFKSDNSTVDYINETEGSASMIKSHIEQGIFYSSSRSIEFDVSERFSEEAVLEAVFAIISEIIDSTSQYLPPFATSIEQFLEIKSQSFHNLISYTRRNFSYVYDACLPAMLDGLEKVEASLNFWKAIASNVYGTADLLTSILNENEIMDSNDHSDLIRNFFTKHLGSINIVLQKFIDQISENNVPKSYVLKLITTILYDGVLLNELKYYQQPDYPTRKSWIFDTHVLFKVNDIFVSVLKEAFNSGFDYRDVIPKVSRVLYYFITEAIKFMEVNGTDDDALLDYIKWYRSNRRKWTEALVHHGLTDDAIFLTEEFRDFVSLAYILNQELEKVSEKFTESSEQYAEVKKKFNFYFEKYDYDFAKGLFDFYLKTGDIQMLINGFPQFDGLLREYFDKNSHKVSSVAWIKHLIDGDNAAASETLLESARIHSNDIQPNQELRYSLAKLTAIASKDQGSELAERQLFNIESKLIYIRIQRKLFEQVVGQVPEKAMTFDTFIHTHVNEALDESTARALFESSYETFVSNHPLRSDDLIRYLTFIRPKRVPHCFAYAFRIASLLQDEKAYTRQLQQVWVRLLAITDDWEQITQTKDLSDKNVVSKLHNTTLYRTVSQLNDGKEIAVLEEMLEKKALDLADEDSLLVDLNQQHFAQVLSYVSEFNLADWIKSIKLQVERSRANA